MTSGAPGLPPPPGLSLATDAALLVIDLQAAIDDPAWHRDGGRNNPAAEANVAALLAAWRRSGRPRLHIRHDSVEPGSAYRPGQPGHAFKPEAQLREAGIGTVVVCGVITNNSVEASVRMAGNLGFDTILAEDACFTFARRDWDGRLRSAAEVHAMSLANLHGEYCRVATTAELLAAV